MININFQKFLVSTLRLFFTFYCIVRYQRWFVIGFECPKRGQSYTKESLLEAVNNIRIGVCTISKASQQYNIPRTTISSYLRGHRGLKSTTYGRPTALDPNVEKKIADNLRVMEKYGFGLSRNEVLNLVGEYVNNNK